MKKFYCFYCQQDVKPRGFWPFRICPNCNRRMSDDGSGFYKVCDVCGANLPTNAHKCVRCGYNFNLQNAVENYEMGAFFNSNAWISWIFIVLALAVSIVAAFGLLYVMLYVIGIMAIFALVVFLFNLLRLWLHI